MNAFLQYTEIKTKITSLFAFLMTLAYLFYLGQELHWQRTLVFFAGMFAFDLTTSAINLYIDSKTNDQVLPFERGRALAILLGLLTFSAAMGLLLVWQTDLLVLAVGALCFAAGVLYTFGPVPISRQPWGELLSGLFYGLAIPFLLLYINLPEGSLVSLELTGETLSLDLALRPLGTLLLLSVPPVACTANIMLANNICDLEKDIAVKRYTLAYYLTGSQALGLLTAIYGAAYGAVVLLVVLGRIHPVCLLTLATLPPVAGHVRRFRQKQEKETTFLGAIASYLLIMGSLTLTLFAGGLLVRLGG